MDKNYLETKELPKEFNQNLSRDLEEQGAFDSKLNQSFEQRFSSHSKSKSSEENNSTDQLIPQSMKQEQILHSIANNDFSQRV